MSKQKNSVISQTVSTLSHPLLRYTGILSQFNLSTLFHIRPTFTRYFTAGSNKVIGGLLILLFLTSLSLITACNSNKDSVFSNDSSGDSGDSSGGSGDSSGGSGNSSGDSGDSSGGSGDSSGGSGGENTPFVDATFGGIEFIAIRHGCFMMGSDDGPADERPAHEVCITRDFYLSKTEVTQKQWKDAGMTPLHKKNDVPVSLAYIFGDDKPAVNRAIFSVSHTISTVAEFTKKLGKKTGGHYRLPTEAEWEYAARAGTTTKYFFGDSTGKNDEVLKKYARFASNSDGKLHKVATRKPNPWGLYDMYGNAYELTQDYYDANYYEESIKNDPVNRTATGDDGVGRVMRGGSYETGNCRGTVCTAKDLRSAARFIFETSHYHSYGFRLLRER